MSPLWLGVVRAGFELVIPVKKQESCNNVGIEIDYSANKKHYILLDARDAFFSIIHAILLYLNFQISPCLLYVTLVVSKHKQNRISRIKFYPRRY